MKLLFLTNVPSPYRVDFFNELGKLCDLTVLFEKATSDERDSSWKKYEFRNFKGVFLKGVSLNTDTAFGFGAIKYVKDRSFDHIICANAASPTGMIAIEYMKRHKIPYFIEGDGGFAKSGKGLKERIKRHFISGAKGYFSTSAAHDEYYITYGAEREKIYRYPFTSLRAEDILSESVTPEEKTALRSKLGITAERVLLSVGQFIPRKGFDVLLEAMAKLPDGIGCYIVGGEPTPEYLDQAARLDLQNVHFVGFKQKEALNQYYMAADLFVLPTREDIWGLVVNEAMAKGLPVVTTNKCIAGLELVKNGEDGYLVSVDDAGQLAERIKEILESRTRCVQMGQKSLEIIRDYTIEKMAQSHMQSLSS